ncbi:MAG: hypothetical protein IPG50_06825 [Myxococcales bacterium]|nr:hypothetical protein [Myxococcales bacterium]
MNDLVELSASDLEVTTGGLNWEGNRLSDNVEDRRTPIDTTGEFARYDRALDAEIADYGYGLSTDITTPGQVRAYDDMMVALDKANDDFVCSNLFGADFPRYDIDTPGEFQRWDKTDSPGGYDGARNQESEPVAPADFSVWGADASDVLNDGGMELGGGNFAGETFAAESFAGGGGGFGGGGGASLETYAQTEQC